MVNKSDKIALFLLNPFLSVIRAIKDIRDGFSHKILYAWFIVFGVGFCAVNEAADSFRYVENFNRECHYSWGEYTDEISEWWTFESSIKDIYTLSVNFFVGRFTDNYHWTYLIYAIVFGFFYIKSLKVFLKYSQRNDWLFYMLLFMFCYSNPIFNINGARFWTAAWIGVFVGLKLFVEKQYRYLPLLLLMPIIHGSSVIWVALLGIAWLSRYFQNIWIVLFIASSFVSAMTYLPLMDRYTDLLPQFMQNQIWAYTESEMAQERLAGHSQYGKAYADFLIALPGYFSLLLSYLLIINRKKINAVETNKILLTIFLSLSAMTNFLSTIPSVGRFMAMVIPFLVIVWIQNADVLKKYNKLFYLVPILYAYSLLYWYRRMTSVTELELYLLPAPVTIIKYLFLT